MPVLWPPLQHGEVLQCVHNIGVLTVERHSRVKKGFQDMFLKQRQNSSRNIVSEQLIQWSSAKLKLDGIASFVIQGIEAIFKRKIKS